MGETLERSDRGEARLSLGDAGCGDTRDCLEFNVIVRFGEITVEFER